MASNMWHAVEKECEVCGQEIGAEKPDAHLIEDGSIYISGATIEDDDGNYLTVCEDCLRAIVRKDWSELESKEE